MLIYMSNMTKVGHTLRISEENYQFIREFGKRLARRKGVDPLGGFNFDSVLSVYISEMEEMRKKKGGV